MNANDLITYFWGDGAPQFRQGAPEHELEELATAKLCNAMVRVIDAANAWYDSEYPPEEGHDQVYPWDHA